MGYGFLGFQDGYLDPDNDVLWKEPNLDRGLRVMEDGQRAKELLMGVDISSPSSSS